MGVRYAAVVSSWPVEPDVRLFWAGSAGGYGGSSAAVVASWQHTPVHNANAADWLALTARCTAPGIWVTGWVGAERLVELTDPRPDVDAGPPAIPTDRLRHHAWVRDESSPPKPGLIVDWRRADGGWQVYMAIANHGSVLARWVPVDDVRSVVDDRPRKAAVSAS